MKNEINSLLLNAFKYSVEGTCGDVVKVLVGVGLVTLGIILLTVTFCLFGVSWKYLD